ncbi:hypothetical protein [Nostoc sp. 'Peltigera malacea cyanobiont' DB3992]|uniref:hypothetical protein n=1 Tax=Nostoc sp. 'Peltigera malacea cyanobiont' DB3992 TaxID=1206980 RepID=UPI000C03DCE8|nr:hypothetical protein [Nostoc sp. 'Peltigera malacea cyanobiont' DB3992]PHM10996.1 hypothetical protein CK516_05340 [Nostoc sp. 'Peltigera malacea cyanobiont' DB3992]
MTKTVPSHTLPAKPKSVIVKLSAIPEKFLESDLKNALNSLALEFSDKSTGKNELMECVLGEV